MRKYMPMPYINKFLIYIKDPKHRTDSKIELDSNQNLKNNISLLRIKIYSVKLWFLSTLNSVCLSFDFVSFLF